jgi:hypothetical protein
MVDIIGLLRSDQQLALQKMLRQAPIPASAATCSSNLYSGGIWGCRISVEAETETRRRRSVLANLWIYIETAGCIH